MEFIACIIKLIKAARQALTRTKNHKALTWKGTDITGGSI